MKEAAKQEDKEWMDKLNKQELLEAQIDEDLEKQAR